MNHSTKYCCFYFQYGKTAKFYVYSPGEIDLNVLIARCKEMPRKTQPEGRPQMHNIQISEKLRHEAFLYSNPPKGKQSAHSVEISRICYYSDFTRNQFCGF